MRLLDFIRSNIELILDEWDHFAAKIHCAKILDPAELRDHGRGILDGIVLDLEHAQTKSQQERKSMGSSPHTPLGTQAELHGVSRFVEGFDVNQMTAEFRALRASVLRLWYESLSASAAGGDDITRFTRQSTR